MSEANTKDRHTEAYEAWCELLPMLALRTQDRARANDLLGLIGGYLGSNPAQASEEEQ